MRFFLSLMASCAAVSAGAQSWAWDDGTVPFVVSPPEIVDRMMRMAEVGKGDTVIDLGSGDGRIVIAAARRGAEAFGVDLDPELVQRASSNAKAAGVEAHARFEVRDLFDTDLSKASVVTLYLLPEFNAKLLPRLLALRPGTRVVSHDGSIGDWPPDERLELRVPEKAVGVGGISTIELWIVPADLRGRWVSELPDHGGRWSFQVAQRYQALDVEVSAQGRDLFVRASRLRGDEIKLAVSGVVDGHAWNQFFEGRVEGDRIDGQVRISDGEHTRTYPWKAQRRP
ncbi:MAG TPA: methyltransferase domain-containing protein [Burkholderiales bacterium]|nr:methyltransferase domain-containing protein [Burkholderiales bacterium]